MSLQSIPIYFKKKASSYLKTLLVKGHRRIPHFLEFQGTSRKKNMLHLPLELRQNTSFPWYIFRLSLLFGSLDILFGPFDNSILPPVVESKIYILNYKAVPVRTTFPPSQGNFSPNKHLIWHEQSAFLIALFKPIQSPEFPISSSSFVKWTFSNSAYIDFVWVFDSHFGQRISLQSYFQYFFD